MTQETRWSIKIQIELCYLNSDKNFTLHIVQIGALWHNNGQNYVRTPKKWSPPTRNLRRVIEEWDSSPQQLNLGSVAQIIQLEDLSYPLRDKQLQAFHWNRKINFPFLIFPNFITKATSSFSFQFMLFYFGSVTCLRCTGNLLHKTLDYSDCNSVWTIIYLF